MNATVPVVLALLAVATTLESTYAQVVLPDSTFKSSVGGSLTYDDGVDAWSSSESRTSRLGAPVHVEQASGPVSFESDARASSGSLAVSLATDSLPGTEWPYGNQASASATAETNDYFVITGGSGVAAAAFHASVEAELSLGAPSAFAGTSNYEFRLTYDVPFGSVCYYEPNGCTAADFTQWIVSEGRTISGVSRSIEDSTDVEGDFLFRYDQPFRLNAYLSATGGQSGEADVAAFARFGILDLPEGAVLTSGAGVGAIAAVPEPGTYALLLLGLAGLGVDRRRRARRNPG